MSNYIYIYIYTYILIKLYRKFWKIGVKNGMTICHPSGTNNELIKWLIHIYTIYIYIYIYIYICRHIYKHKNNFYQKVWKIVILSIFRSFSNCLVEFYQESLGKLSYDNLSSVCYEHKFIK